MRQFHLLLALAAGAAYSSEAIAQRPDSNLLKKPSWSQRFGDEGRRGRTWAPGPDQGVVAWKTLTHGQVPSIAVNGFGQAILGVYFVDESWSGDSYFAALNRDGTWDARLQVQSYDWGASQGVNSGPALTASNTLFFNSTDGQVRRYSPAFDLLQVIQRSTSATNDSAPAVLSDGTMFHYQIIQGLKKFDPKGNLVWTTGVSSLRTDVAVAPNGDSAMSGVRTSEPHGSTDLTYIDKNGVRRWVLTSTRGSNHQPSFGTDGSLYYGGSKYNTQTGAILWSSGAGASPPSHGWKPELYIAGFAEVRAVRTSDGSTIWTTPVPDPVQINSGMALDGRGFLYLTTRNGRFLKIDTATGAVVYDRQVAPEIRTGPVIGVDNSAYFTVRDGFTNYVYKVL